MVSDMGKNDLACWLRYCRKNAWLRRTCRSRLHKHYNLFCILLYKRFYRWIRDMSRSGFRCKRWKWNEKKYCRFNYFVYIFTVILTLICGLFSHSFITLMRIPMIYQKMPTATCLWFLLARVRLFLQYDFQYSPCFGRLYFPSFCQLY